MHKFNFRQPLNINNKTIINFDTDEINKNKKTELG